MPRSGGGSGFGLTDLSRITHGKGSYLYDESGKAYLDGSGGPAVFCLGHAHPEVNAAITSQLQNIAYAYRYLFSSAALEGLTALLLRLSGNVYKDILYNSSGSEAIESALKVALQYFAARGLMKKRRFISRRRSWHGDSLGALSVSGFAARRQSFEGSLLDARFVSAANAYRPPEGCEPGLLVDFLTEEFERALLHEGPENVAAFIFEPVVGAAAGVVPSPPGYAAAIAAICRKYDVLVIADEVMCGSGRTGTWRALAHDQVVADIMCIAKGLAAGYIPLSATLVSERISQPILNEHGAYRTGHTFSGHTAACAAGLAVQQIIERDRLLDRVRDAGAALQQTLREALSRFEEAGDVRGRGFFIGIELVENRKTRAPFPKARALSYDIAQRAFMDGLICYPCSGNVDGEAGDTIIVAPPYNAKDVELEEIVVKLTRAIGSALSS